MTYIVITLYFAIVLFLLWQMDFIHLELPYKIIALIQSLVMAFITMLIMGAIGFAIVSLTHL